MVLEFKIGRNSDNDYVISDDTVSKLHASIIVSSDYRTYNIKDNESTNGTFVNDQQIVLKRIKEYDKIRLGNYKINSKDIFAKLNGFVIDKRIDFSVEFQNLKQIEEDYNRKKENTNKYYKFKSAAIRMLITIALIFFVFKIFSDMNVNLRMTLMIVIGVLGTTISSLSISERKLKHKLDMLFVNYTRNFSCPKCKYELTSRSWNYWNTKQKCPKCKCIWVNNN